MKKYVVTISALLTSCAIVHADPVKLSVEKASLLYQGLDILNPNMPGQPIDPRKPTSAYRFKSDVTYAIAIDISHLSDVVQTYQKLYKSTFDEIAKDRPGDELKGAGAFKPGSEAEKQLTDKMSPAWAAEQTIELMKIRVKDLNIGTDTAKENQIPPSALVPIIPVLVEQ